MQATQQGYKTIQKIFTPTLQSEGVGAEVARIIGGIDVPRLDPFLMLDFFDSKLPAGFPDHPHRGFETITYLQKGSIYHEDFLGNKGTLFPGDIQWMTAGKGIVHAEMPGSYNEHTQGYQLWLNLAIKDKFQNPGYQEHKSSAIPVIYSEGVEIKLIAGEALNQKGIIKAQTESYYMDIKMNKNAIFEQKIPKQWNSLLSIYEGQGFIGIDKQKASKSQAVVFKQEDNQVLRIEAGNEGFSFMLMAGKPLNEPIFQHGPFVLGSKQDLYQTFEDYQECKNGFENRKKWESSIQNLAHQN